MLRHPAVTGALFLLFCTAADGAGNARAKAQRIFELSDVVFFVSNPKFLLTGMEAYDTTDTLLEIVRGNVVQYLREAGVNRWRCAPNSMTRKMTLGFNMSAERPTGVVKQLPYTTQEFLEQDSVKRFVAFYLYHEERGATIRSRDQANISIPFITPGASFDHPAMSFGSINIAIDIAFENVQFCMAYYDLAGDSSTFVVRTDDENYTSAEEIVEELFEKLGF